MISCCWYSQRTKKWGSSNFHHAIWGLMLIHIWSNMAPNCISEDYPHVCWKKYNKQMWEKSHDFNYWTDMFVTGIFCDVTRPWGGEFCEMVNEIYRCASLVSADISVALQCFVKQPYRNSHLYRSVSIFSTHMWALLSKITPCKWMIQLVINLRWSSNCVCEHCNDI